MRLGEVEALALIPTGIFSHLTASQGSGWGRQGGCTYLRMGSVFPGSHLEGLRPHVPFQLRKQPLQKITLHSSNMFSEECLSWRCFLGSDTLGGTVCALPHLGLQKVHRPVKAPKGPWVKKPSHFVRVQHFLDLVPVAFSFPCSTGHHWELALASSPSFSSQHLLHL